MKVYVAFGSQTGTARSIARGLAGTAVAEHGLPVEVVDLENFERLGLGTGPRLLVVVTATHGEGDPPDNAFKFWRHLRRHRKGETWLEGSAFAVLGLGDTNYENFCNMGLRLDKKLDKLGADRFYPLGKADDATGLEDVVDPWIEGLWEPLVVVFLERGGELIEADGGAREAWQIEPEAEATGDATDKGGDGAADGGATTEGQPATAIGAATATTTTADEPTPATTTSADEPTPAATTADAKGKGKGKGKEKKKDKKKDKKKKDKGKGAKAAGIEVRWIGESGTTERSSPDPPSGLSPAFATATAARLVNEGYVFAAVAGATRVSSDDAVRHTLYLELGLPAPTRLAFEPGDAIDVMPRNDPALVDEVLALLGADGDQAMTVVAAEGAKRAPGGHLLPDELTTLRELLSCAVDLTGLPSKKVLRAVADGAPPAADAEAAALVALTLDDLLATHPTLADLLALVPGTAPDLARLLEALPPLKPRPYSVATDPRRSWVGRGGWDEEEHDGEAEGGDYGQVIGLLFNVMAYQSGSGRVRRGVASGWLNEVAQAAGGGDGAGGDDDAAALAVVPVRIRPMATTHFRLPASDAGPVPLLMAGAGTGLAPFLSFLDAREAAANDGNAVAPARLFFGCRSPAADFLFRSYLEACDVGLEPAFSQAPDLMPKTYVQDLLRADGASIYAAMADDTAPARLYLCGDAKGLASGVKAALVQIVAEHGDVADEDAAADVVEDWIADFRFLMDVWA